MGSARTERVVSWWEGHYYPDAGEVVGWRETRRLMAGEETSYPPSMVRERPVPGSAGGPVVPPEGSAERATRRARTRLRRYAVANKLRYLWVLTYAPDDDGMQVFDLDRAKRDVASWVKRGLRETLGYSGAYAIGWERHKSGAWHLNVLLGERIEHAALRDSWRHGNVWVSVRNPRGVGQREAARRAASYVAKYIAKEFADAPARTHRYEVAQGFQLRQVRVYALSATGVIEECGDSGPVTYRFDAAAPEAGRGPPIVWAAFGG